MTENKQNRNSVSLNSKSNGTHEYINLYLHPWNNDRKAFYIKAIITATIIFEDNFTSIERMVNILNNRLDSPLTVEEQDKATCLLQYGIQEELL
ncbi:hypothetical protein [Weissella viridescens]|uniref:hypothetical protein n=1 Tax=Weissella viridescens TaxID=1629 RepID=UPI003AF2CD82